MMMFLDVFKPSIVKSIISPFIIIPSNEYSPIFSPNTIPTNNVITRSHKSTPLPRSSPVNLFIIFDKMSVPPIEAYWLSIIAIPTADTITAIIIWSNKSSITGPSSGIIFSKINIISDMPSEVSTVFTPNLLPMNKNPKANKTMFVANKT